MILHTILPMEEIFPQKLPEIQLKRINGCLCECIQGETGRLTVSRLISTDPADYLRPEFFPGAQAIKEDSEDNINF